MVCRDDKHSVSPLARFLDLKAEIGVELAEPISERFADGLLADRISSAGEGPSASMKGKDHVVRIRVHYGGEVAVVHRLENISDDGDVLLRHRLLHCSGRLEGGIRRRVGVRAHDRPVSDGDDQTEALAVEPDAALLALDARRQND